MNDHQWHRRQLILRQEATRLLSVVTRNEATEDEKAALNNLLQAMLALLPMVNARIFDAAVRNSEINSYIRELYHEGRKETT